MNIEKAKNTVWELGKKSVMTADEEFTYIESLEFLIDETKDTDYMTQLGGYYYGKKIYDLALKYYEMADTYGDKWAAEGLGYIWYYGRTGEVDYEKAFKYYSKAADNGYLQAKIKVADMYKNGYYVDKDYDKYCRIIEHAKKDVKIPGNCLIRFRKYIQDWPGSENSREELMKLLIYTWKSNGSSPKESSIHSSLEI